MNSGFNDDDDQLDQPTRHAQDIAKLGLLLDEATAASGQKPTFEELWQWMQGEVTAGRAQEILSHVARDPEVYSQWHQLRSAQREFSEVPVYERVSATQPAPTDQQDQSAVADGAHRHSARTTAVTGGDSWFKRLVGYFSPAPFAGMALAAVLGGVVAVNINKTQPVDVWEDWLSPKSFGDTQALPDQHEVEAVLAGMAAKLGELSLPMLGPDGKRLPRMVPECTSNSEDDLCTERRHALYSLGQLAIRSRIVCLTSVDLPDEVTGELRSIHSILSKDTAANRFTGLIDDWIQSNERKQHCAIVNQIMARALKGLSA